MAVVVVMILVQAMIVLQVFLVVPAMTIGSLEALSWHRVCNVIRLLLDSSSSIAILIVRWLERTSMTAHKHRVLRVIWLSIVQ